MSDEVRHDGERASANAEPSTTLRGAAVAVDPRRVGAVALVLCVTALAVSGVVLLAAGARRNSQIDALKTDGSTISSTVTSCIGELGGSGSNLASYSCRVTYRVAQHRYDAALPGSGLSAPRSKVTIVIDQANPTLISTPGILATEHASASVFALPIALLVCALALGWGAVWRHRRRRAKEVGAQPSPRSLSDFGDDDRLGALGGV